MHVEFFRRIIRVYLDIYNYKYIRVTLDLLTKYKYSFTQLKA